MAVSVQRVSDLERHVRELLSANEKLKQKTNKLKTQRESLQYELAIKCDENENLTALLEKEKVQTQKFLGHDLKSKRARPTSRHNLRMHVNELALEEMRGKLATWEEKGQELVAEEKDRALLEAYKKFEEVCGFSAGLWGLFCPAERLLLFVTLFRSLRHPSSIDFFVTRREVDLVVFHHTIQIFHQEEECRRLLMKEQLDDTIKSYERKLKEAELKCADQLSSQEALYEDILRGPQQEQNGGSSGDVGAGGTGGGDGRADERGKAKSASSGGRWEESFTRKRCIMSVVLRWVMEKSGALI